MVLRTPHIVPTSTRFWIDTGRIAAGCDTQFYYPRVSLLHFFLILEGFSALRFVSFFFFFLFFLLLFFFFFFTIFAVVIFVFLFFVTLLSFCFPFASSLPWQLCLVTNCTNTQNFGSKIINYGPLSELRHQLVEGGYDSTGEIFPQHRGVSLYIYDVKHLQLENNNFSDFET